MSNRLYNQFSYSPERQPINLMGKFIQVVAESVATLFTVDDTFVLSAQTAGAAGNDITITLINPVANGSLSIVVTGSNIVVTLAKAGGNLTTTGDDLVAALDGDPNASALVSASPGSNSTNILASLPITHLSGGADAVMTTNAMNMSMTNTSSGVYILQLQDNFPEVLSAQVTIFSPASNVQPAIVASTDLAFGGDKTVVIKTNQLAANDGMFVHLILRNSSNP